MVSMSFKKWRYPTKTSQINKTRNQEWPYVRVLKPYILHVHVRVKRVCSTEMTSENSRLLHTYAYTYKYGLLNLSIIWTHYTVCMYNWYHVLLGLFPGVLWLWHFLYKVGQQPVSSLLIYTFVVLRAFMAGAVSQAGDADSSQAPCFTIDLQGSVNVHRGALLLVPQWQCISSFCLFHEYCKRVYICKTYYLILNHFQYKAK